MVGKLVAYHTIIDYYHLTECTLYSVRAASVMIKVVSGRNRILRLKYKLPWLDYGKNKSRFCVFEN